MKLLFSGRNKVLTFCACLREDTSIVLRNLIVGGSQRNHTMLCQRYLILILILSSPRLLPFKRKIVWRSSQRGDKVLALWPAWRISFRIQLLYRERRSRETGGALPSHFFPNVIFKQLRFRTLVMRFSKKACKMLNFYLKPPPPSFHSKFRSRVPVYK